MCIPIHIYAYTEQLKPGECDCRPTPRDCCANYNSNTPHAVAAAAVPHSAMELLVCACVSVRTPLCVYLPGWV